eukprot:353130-Chlamydomonas_euryale.AAC.3
MLPTRNSAFVDIAAYSSHQRHERRATHQLLPASRAAETNKQRRTLQVLTARLGWTPRTVGKPQ